MASRKLLRLYCPFLNCPDSENWSRDTESFHPILSCLIQINLYCLPRIFTQNVPNWDFCVDYSILYFNCITALCCWTFVKCRFHTHYIHLKVTATFHKRLEHHSLPSEMVLEETVDGEPATRQKDLPPLWAGQFCSVCDAMTFHTMLTIVLYVCIPALNVACLGQTHGCAV